MRTTVHLSIKETPFERHYGRKPRTEMHNYLNISPNKRYVLDKPETLQVYPYSNGSGNYDQLVMKTPRKFKEDVGNKVSYLFLEKNHNLGNFESIYENKPQVAIAATKHTILTDKNKMVQRKRASKPKKLISEPALKKRRKSQRGGRQIHHHTNK